MWIGIYKSWNENYKMQVNKKKLNENYETYFQSFRK